MKNRILSAVLSFALFASAGSFAVFAADGGAAVGGVYEEAAQCLKDLGGAEYTEETDFGAEVTRGDFCKIITEYFDIAPTANVSTTPFVDVEMTHEDFGDIRVLYDLGYITGDENRRFYPDRAITVREALTVIVTALGYKYEAMQRGGYPTGFISVAEEKEMLTEAFESYEGSMTLGSIYKMLYDCLDVPVMTREFDGGRETYVVSDENTVLWVYFKTVKDEGIVTAGKYTALTSAAGRVPDGQTAVDDTVYYSNRDYSDMLGMNVVYYISREDGGNGTIVHMSGTDNEITEILSEDIETISDSEVTYITDGARRRETARLSADIDVIYNGRALTGYGTLADIMPVNGTTVLVDNDRDGRADVMNITEYENFYVSALDKSARIVYDYISSKSIDMGEGAETAEIYDAEGNKTAFSSLMSNTLISVTQSRGGSDKLIRAYVCGTQIEGAADSVSDDEYTIGGTSYKKAPGMTTEVQVGKQGIFYIDIMGKIGAFRTSADTSYSYGLIYNVVYDSNTEEFFLILYTPNEKFEEYDLSSKTALNGVSLRTDDPGGAQTLLDALETGMVIRYRMSDDGSGIAAIETPLPMDDDGSGNKTPAESTDFRVLYEGSSFKYRNGMLDGKLVINDETVIFSVPKSENWKDKTLFGTLSTGSFSGGTSYSKNYTAYAVGENAVNDADVMVIEDITKGSIGNSTNMVLVTGLSSGIDTDQNVCTIINGVSAGNVVEYYCIDDQLIEDSGLEKGDIIRVGLDSSNNVKSIQKIYNADGSSRNGALLAPGDGVSENTASFDSEFRVAIGTVLDRDNTYMKFSMQKKSGDEFYNDMSICQITEATVVKYERDNPYGEPSPCSINDILEGDTVIIRMRLASAREIIILR